MHRNDSFNYNKRLAFCFFKSLRILASLYDIGALFNLIGVCAYYTCRDHTGIAVYQSLYDRLKPFISG